MPEGFPDQLPPPNPHVYPHETGEVTAAQLAQDIAAHPDAYHPGLDPHMRNNNIEVQRPMVDEELMEERRALGAVAEIGTSAEGRDDSAEQSTSQLPAQVDTIGVTIDTNADARETTTVADKGPDEAEVNAGATVEAEQRGRVAQYEKEIAQLRNQFGEELPPHVQDIIARIQEARDRTEAELPGRIMAAREAHRKGQAEQDSRRRLESRRNALPWQLPEAYVGAGARDVLRESYEGLMYAESRAPQPEDIIPLPLGLTVDDKEYAMLKHAGLSDEQISSGSLTRKELTDAGFFFVNRLGGGEKGIINDVIPDPKQPGEVLDFSQRALLTRDELQAAYAHQQQEGDGLRGNQLESVRADMLLFLMSMKSRGPFASMAELGAKLIPDTSESDDWLAGTEAERQAVLDQYGSYPKEDMYILDSVSWSREGYVPVNWSRLIDDNTISMGGGKVQGRNHVTGTTIYERTGKLMDAPSPFLESGFRFGNNPDVLISMPGNQGEQRFNITNIHLAGGHPDFPGLSEMGKADWDQQYMTTGEYVEKFYAPPDRIEELESAEKGGWLTRRERIQAEDMLYLDPNDLRQRVIKNGQLNLIDSVQRAP